MPIPEVKPGKPNLSPQTGNLHGFWDKDLQQRIPNRCLLQDVTCQSLTTGKVELKFSALLGTAGHP